MNKLIVFYGAAGVGKTTMTKILKAKLGVPAVHYDWLRRFHLDDEWSQTSHSEADMAFKNLVGIVKNYFENGYQTVIVDFLYRDQQEQLPMLFEDTDVQIFTLLVDDDDELKRRVLSERDGGWKLYEESIKVNKEIEQYPMLPHEVRIETSKLSEEQVAIEVFKALDIA